MDVRLGREAYVSDWIIELIMAVWISAPLFYAMWQEL
jgi:hypothetical protein